MYIELCIRLTAVKRVQSKNLVQLSLSWIEARAWGNQTLCLGLLRRGRRITKYCESGGAK
jgi:hypothetical protein